jgi:hypothetical protein
MIQVMPGKKTVKWNEATLGLIMQTTEQLQAEGMSHPSIRAVLYRLLSKPGWTKARYNTLCRKLGEWRDRGLINFGIFTDEGGGARDRPYTPREISDYISAWKKMKPAKLLADGNLHALLVEHQSLVSQVEEWADGQGLVASSAGQLRRENLWHAVKEWQMMKDELGAKEIIIYGLFDYDQGGDYIAKAHARWFRKVMKMDMIIWGLTRKQVIFLKLPPNEDHQIDGAFGINPAWWKTQILQLLLGPQAR